LDGADLHVVTGLLKLFFRLAPMPLFTVEAHADFLSGYSRPDANDRYAGLFSSFSFLWI
jgi:hypothetical protein